MREVNLGDERDRGEEKSSQETIMDLLTGFDDVLRVAKRVFQVRFTLLLGVF